MQRTSALVSVLATGSILAMGLVAPAMAQNALDNGPLGPLGGLVTAPVVAAGQIVAAPVTAAGDIFAPGMAQSSRTAAFVTNAMANINFINDASRMALERSGNPAIRRVAYRLADEQTIAGNSMTAWADTSAPLMTGRSAYDPNNPIAGLVSLPFNVVAGTGNMLTGGNFVASSDGRTLLSAQADDLSRLSAMNGPDFNQLYRSTQLDSLHQLVTLYTDYAINGDDPGLRALARSELPKIKMRIHELNRI